MSHELTRTTRTRPTPQIRAAAHLGLLLLLLLGALRALADCQPDSALENRLSGYMSCNTPADDWSACNAFVGRALEDNYGESDFVDSALPNGYMLANDIYQYVDASPFWSRIGPAGDEAADRQAQQLACDNHAVIAIMAAPGGTGHVTLIVPGRQSASQSWGTDLPRAAGFRLMDVSGAFVGRHLGFGFGSGRQGSVYYFYRVL